MREFAESEIVIPDGPFSGLRYKIDRLPLTGLWFDAIDSGRWQRFVATGPTQSGKSLSCFVIPILYHLFEIEETVICGIPNLDMVGDKWRETLLPVIERSRYRDLMPYRGSGSRGGEPTALQFRNGATLRFMTGGGGDKSRAGFTSRVLVITETDGMDESGESSREADKIKQLEARTRAYGSRRRVYMECTVSVEEGRTWKEYQTSTNSRIVTPCRYCQSWISPEREHLVGWSAAGSDTEAASLAAFACPNCRTPWTADDRKASNASMRLVHKGQSIEADGKILGDIPPGNTFGFRWSAYHNLFIEPGDIGADEWRAAQDQNQENAEKEMRQFVWAVPFIPDRHAMASLDVHSIARRSGDMPRGIVPDDAEQLTLGIDCGKWLLHWVVVAWMKDGRGHVVDYGSSEVLSNQLGLERALMASLRELGDQALAGWPIGHAQGEKIIPGQVWIDSNYSQDVVYEFCRSPNVKSTNRFRPAVGRGIGQIKQSYSRPKSTGAIVRHVGEGYHIAWIRPSKLFLVEVDANYWKSWLHERLMPPIAEPDTIQLFKVPDQREHLSLARHLTAERQVEEYVAGEGLKIRWEQIRRQNHWLDASYLACAAGHFCGHRLSSCAAVRNQVQPRKSAASRPNPLKSALGLIEADEYLVTQRR